MEVENKNQSATEWLSKIIEGQKDKPFDYDEWLIAIEHAKNLEELRTIRFGKKVADHWGMTTVPTITIEKFYDENFKTE
jgi:hypothetical protein